MLLLLPVHLLLLVFCSKASTPRLRSTLFLSFVVFLLSFLVYTFSTYRAKTPAPTQHLALDSTVRHLMPFLASLQDAVCNHDAAEILTSTSRMALSETAGLAMQMRGTGAH